MKLHIYGQVFNHDHAFIVGNKASLEALRDAIQATIDAKATPDASFYTADGEGFFVKVYREEEEAYWNKAMLPYTDSDTVGHADDDIGPWDLYGKYKNKP